jgi:enoyl-CoA hydratase/carnithine racemase
LQAALSGGVLAVSWNRTEAGEVLTTALLRELEGLLQDVAADSAVRVLLLRIGGHPVASDEAAADADTGRAEAPDADTQAAAAHGLVRVQRLLRRLPQPVLAAVQGPCEGRAIALVEACDVVFAADDARFVLAAADGDLALEGTLAKSASRVMAPRAARFHALTGRAFDGCEAERCGLVTRSWPAADLDREVATLAAEWLAKDALALQFTKETLQHVGTMDWDAVLNFNAAKFAELKALQAGRPSARAAAVESFLAGKSKPGLGG